MIRAERILFLGFAIALLLCVAYSARQALLVIYVSTVFAVVLSPAVDRVHTTFHLALAPQPRSSDLALLPRNRSDRGTSLRICPSSRYFRSAATYHTTSRSSRQASHKV